MAINDLQALETQIESKKRDLAKAEGVMEQTEGRWKKDYDETDIEAVTTIRDNLKTQISNFQKKRSELVSRAQEILNGSV